MHPRDLAGLQTKQSVNPSAHFFTAKECILGRDERHLWGDISLQLDEIYIFQRGDIQLVGSGIFNDKTMIYSG